MLVKPSSRSSVRTILAAVDPVHERDKPADLDHEIIGSAQQLSTALGAELHIVHAFDPAPAYAVSADAMSFPIAEPVNELIQSLKRRHEHAMEDLLSRYSFPSDRVHINEGDTRDVLVATIEALGADLLVMGAVSRSAVQRLLLGSTAELVLDFVPCDLLIVKRP
jgi:universal stress protein E